MCTNLTPIPDREVTGYKVVLEKNGRQYSPAMGIRYHDGKLTKIPRKQAKLVITFNDGILDPKRGAGFEPKMVGRTAAFIHERHAIEQALSFNDNTIREGYKVCVYLVKLSNGLMKGRYGASEPVYAGKRMTFISKKLGRQKI